jgi:hypothetical protein
MLRLFEVLLTSFTHALGQYHNIDVGVAYIGMKSISLFLSSQMVGKLKGRHTNYILTT